MDFILNKALSEREIKIIKLHYELEVGTQWTLHEIAQIYGVSRERIRQIIMRVIRKLKKYKNYYRSFITKLL